MMRYTYALVLFLTVIICFIASFDRRIRFDRYFPAFIKAGLLVAVPFIAWDVWFTARGVCWFNTDYTLGIVIAGLPLEELLFFICIPCSCVFTYFCFDKFFKLVGLAGFNTMIVFMSVVVCAVVALVHYDKIYTFVTAVSKFATLYYLHFIAHASRIGNESLVFSVML